MKKQYFIPRIIVMGIENKDVLTGSVEIVHTDDWREENVFFEFISE